MKKTTYHRKLIYYINKLTFTAQTEKFIKLFFVVSLRSLLFQL